MGRQAKLKRQRRQQRQNPPADSSTSRDQDADPTHFVERLEKEGYRIKSGPRCPEIPEDDEKPQL
ncbi:hypothetical protein [Lyngbya sp. CCY1209]|uniref:hypothetical protein n=1 Tax=Lyngbya sp. CCY1209 TaxID=2886103 RepID=UPI002D215018|nr:hypothetical protein [Lyngbya sp. CCY1209]MEB3886360.1 hypothetical protein [Lyngbya sp. CCY1209]